MPSKDWWNELLASIDAKDTAKFVSYLAPDGEFIFGNAPAAVGHAAVGAAVDGFFGMIGRSQHRLTDAWEGPDSAVCEAFMPTWRLIPRPSGFAQVFPVIWQAPVVRMSRHRIARRGPCSVWATATVRQHV